MIELLLGVVILVALVLGVTLFFYVLKNNKNKTER